MACLGSTKYLGNILSTNGGQDDNIEDRRCKGWGKISTIMGILSEIDMGVHKLEAGLILRQAILISSMLFSAEAWSGVTNKQLARLEVVDSALLRRLTGGHAKCPSEFLHLETKTWKLRHHLSYLRLIFHHHILTREKEETISKIYYKQKESALKGDWLQLLKSDFEFIGEEQNDEEIIKVSKSEYKKKIKELINKATFQMLLDMKKTHTKLDNISYPSFEKQQYLKSKHISNFEKELMFNLRSRCHNSKSNFKKLNNNSIKCKLGCHQDEDQLHTFIQCTKLKNTNHSIKYEHIFGTLDEQTEAIKMFACIDLTRNHIIKNHLSPGGACCRDPCTFNLLIGAAPVIQM